MFFHRNGAKSGVAATSDAISLSDIPQIKVDKCYNIVYL